MGDPFMYAPNILIAQQSLDKRTRFGAGKMAPWMKALANKPGGLSSFPGLPGWKERPDSQQFSSDLYTLHKTAQFRVKST